MSLVRSLAVLLCLLPLARCLAEEPAGEAPSPELEKVAECFDLAVDDLGVLPQVYDSLHAFFQAAQEAAADNEEQAAILDQLDLAGGEVRLGDQTYTWRTRRKYAMYSDGENESEKLFVVCELVETSTGQTVERETVFRW